MYAGKRGSLEIRRDRQRARPRRGSNAFARVTLPEYALIDPVGGLAIGLLRTDGGIMPGAAVQTLTPVSEILAPFLWALMALTLPSDVS